MFGKGLLNGLRITLKRMLGPNLTEFYPEIMPKLPPRTRSSLTLHPEKCLSCGLCANACPTQVIHLTSEKGDTNKKVLMTYKMNIGRCLFCGLCIEACPSGALTVSPAFENAVYHRVDLLWDMIERAQRET